MKLFIKLLSDRTITIQSIQPNDTIATLKMMIFEAEGHALDEQRLIFNGKQLQDDLSILDYGLEEATTIHLVLRRRGMTKTFTSFDVVSDPLLSYLMMTESVRANSSVPIDQLRKVQSLEKAEEFYTYSFIEDPNILHESQRAILCEFLEFMFKQTSMKEKDEGPRDDLRVSLTVEQISAILGVLDWSIGEEYKSRNTIHKFSNWFHKVPHSRPARDPEGNYNYKLALRITRGPTIACVAFHCDAEFATSTSEIPLNDPSDYKGGESCFFVNDCLHIVPRPAGSVCQHPPKVLRGATRVTEGTRMSLCIVDDATVNGDPNIIGVTSDHIVDFLASGASN